MVKGKGRCLECCVLLAALFIRRHLLPLAPLILLCRRHHGARGGAAGMAIFSRLMQSTTFHFERVQWRFLDEESATSTDGQSQSAIVKTILLRY